MFSYVSHEKLCLRNVGLGIMAGLKENIKEKLNLSTLAVTSHTLKSEQGLFTKV